MAWRQLEPEPEQRATQARRRSNRRRLRQNTRDYGTRIVRARWSPIALLIALILIRRVLIGVHSATA